MQEVFKALGFIGLGMIVAHSYNWLAWRKFYEGRREYEARRRGREA